MKTTLLSWSIVAFVASCGGTEPGPGSGGSSTLANTTSFCQAWGKAACNAEVVDACGASDADACARSQQGFCLNIVDIVGYNSQHAQECLDAVKAAYTDANLDAEELEVVLHLADPCHRLIKGSGNAGATCSENADCNTLDDLRCVIKPGQTQGSCQVPEEVGGGDRCDGPEQVCAEGYYCSVSNCIAYKDLGDACTYDAECSPENRCNAVAGADGECIARLEDTEICTADAECQSHICARSVNATEGVCVSDIRLSAAIPLCEDLR